MTMIRSLACMILLHAAALPVDAADERAGSKRESTPRDRDALTQVIVGRASAPAGATVSVPVSVRDGYQSPLGLEKAGGIL